MVSHRARQSRPNFSGLLGLYCFINCTTVWWNLQFNELLVTMLKRSPGKQRICQCSTTPFSAWNCQVEWLHIETRVSFSRMPFEFLWGCSKTVWKLSVPMNLCFFGSSSVSTSSSWASMSLLTSTSSSSSTSSSGPSSGTKAQISSSSAAPTLP